MINRRDESGPFLNIVRPTASCRSKRVANAKNTIGPAGTALGSAQFTRADGAETMVPATGLTEKRGAV